MSDALPPLAPAGRADDTQTPSIHRVLGLITAAFALLWLLQTLAGWVNLKARGGTGSLLGLLGTNGFYYPPWIAFSAWLLRALDRRRDELARLVVLSRFFVLGAIFFFVPYVVYQPAIELLHQGRPLSRLPQAVSALPPFIVFVDFILYVGCFGTLYGFAVMRGQVIREHKRRELESQMLKLRLELERQRLASIQAQLEPHFLFNALNAISALVRTEERATALAAISRLSGLLRYALTASKLDRVTLREELHFVRDYLDLQRLRYGARLESYIRVEEDSLLELACPPLLLQPLVENALRHDLETQEGPSDLELSLERQGDGARIKLSNPWREGGAANAGLGLGLSTTRERLMLRYGGAAQLSTSQQNGRFVVELFLPEWLDG